MIQRLLLTAALALPLFADGGVFVTPNGKTYHDKRSCMSLMRSKVIIETSIKTAVAKGMKPCGICYRKKREAVQ